MLRLRRNLLSVAVAAAGALATLLLAAGPAAAQGTVKHVVPADLRVVDPLATTAQLTRNHGFMIYDTLFAPDSAGVLKPQMVQSFQVSPDLMTYRFVLRPGLAWHDGPPVRAADVVASLTRWSQKDSMGKAMVSAGAQFVAENDSTFTITLKKPFGLVIDALGKLSNHVPFIMPERIAKTDVNTPIKDNIGSGPFIFKADEWVQGSKWVYVKNPKYVPRSEPADGMAGGKVVKLDRVEWLYIPDQNTARAALMNGEVDYFEQPSLDFVKTFKQSKDIVVPQLGFFSQYQGWIRPNSLHPPFNNPKARQALVYMTKQSDYMAAIGVPEGLYLPNCFAYMMCGGPNEGSGSKAPTAPDLERAKQLLAEAGYKGEKLVVLQPTDVPSLNASTSVVIRDLRRIGVNVEVVQTDWTTLTARRAKKEPPAQGGWNIVLTQAPAADSFLPLSNFGINSSCDSAWPGWACDPEMEKLRQAWTDESDPARRKSLVDQIQARAQEMVPTALWGQFTQPPAYRANLKNVIFTVGPVFWNMEKQ